MYWRGRDQGREYVQNLKTHKNKLNLDRGKITPIKYLLSIELKDCGGDIVTGAATVISAMGTGRCAAADIDEYLRG